MTNRYVVALRSRRQTRRAFVIGAAGATGNLILVFCGVESFLTAMTLSALLFASLVRWRGDFVVSYAIKAVRLLAYSRFHAIAVQTDANTVTIECRGRRSATTWISSHRGRPDLSDDESRWWGDVLHRMSVASLHGGAVSLSCHFRGFAKPELATVGFDVGEPWVAGCARIGVPQSRWMYESWTWVRTPEGFSRAFQVDDFTHARGNLIAAMSDADGRWSVHVHFVSHARQRAVHQTRRARHEASAASLWRTHVGKTVSTTAVSTEDAFRWHEQKVAEGAALIDFRCSVIVTSNTVEALDDVTRDLADTCRRGGIRLSPQHGQHARVIASSWVGSSPW